MYTLIYVFVLIHTCTHILKESHDIIYGFIQKKNTQCQLVNAEEMTESEKSLFCNYQNNNCYKYHQ